MDDRRKWRIDRTELAIHLIFGTLVMLELTFLAYHLGWIR